jgi:hypothetical protein
VIPSLSVGESWPDFQPHPTRTVDECGTLGRTTGFMQYYADTLPVHVQNVNTTVEKRRGVLYHCPRLYRMIG